MSDVKTSRDELLEAFKMFDLDKIAPNRANRNILSLITQAAISIMILSYHNTITPQYYNTIMRKDSNAII